MEYYHLSFFCTALVVGIFALYGILKRANTWFYAIKFSSKKYNIPPGYMGWPYIGNTLTYFKSSIGDGGSFLSYFVTRFGSGGMYKAHIFGKPSIIVTKPEIIMKIMMDEEYLNRGLPDYMNKLVGRTTSVKEDKHIRRLTAPIKSHELLSDLFSYIDRVVRTTLEKYAATEKPVEFLSEMKKLTFEVFMKFFIGDEVDPQLFDEMFKEITCLISGMHNLPINIPGFPYHKALKARRKLEKIFQQILDERRKAMTIIAKDYKAMPRSNIVDMMLLDTNDEGKRLSDDKIIEVLILFTFAGFEPVALMATKTLMNLEKHPHFLEEAKKEQEDIIKKRPSSNVGLNFVEVKQMTYLNKVITETLRLASDQTVFLRDTNNSYNINGYTIPKGWKFFVPIRNVHMDPNVYIQPKEFNPSRWDDMIIKPGYYLPFSMGPKACPGSNLAKLQISVILHYFLLYYRVEQVNPKSFTYPPENCLVKFKKLSVSTDYFNQNIIS